MSNKKFNIAFFGSSIVSAYWNGAATYYRGIVKALHRLGHHITFYEPDIYERQRHRDIPDPDYCDVVVYKKNKDLLSSLLLKAQRESDIIIKTSGVGAFDRFLEAELPRLKNENNLILFWDVDAPATLERMQNDSSDPFIHQLPHYDCILTYGGGTPVVRAYRNYGASLCVPIYNALDTDTHYPVPPDKKYEAHLSFLGNRLPDRKKRVEEFFIQPARKIPDKNFIIGGSGWEDHPLADNIRHVGHVYTAAHNAFNSSPLAVLNISRDSMAKYGYSPATRVFEAAGAAACIITDHWEGIEMFFEPGEEILIARDGNEVTEILRKLTPEQARKTGRAAYHKALQKHTYRQRAELLDEILSQAKRDHFITIETQTL